MSGQDRNRFNIELTPGTAHSSVGDEWPGLMELDQCMREQQMLQPRRRMGKELALHSWRLPTITAHQLSCRAVLCFLPHYRNISRFQGLLILCTLKSLHEIHAPICFQPKNRYSISMGKRKLFYFSRLFLCSK